jgi:hypothetical protein
MLAATGNEGDGKNTAKSANCQAAYDALYGSAAGGSIRHFIWQILKRRHHVSTVSIQTRFWIGWVTTGVLKESLCELNCRK